jgi:enoyl-CoA hydratase/carnithine racemase
MNTAPVTSPWVKIEVIGWTGTITLTRPNQINALATEMFVVIREALTRWAIDPEIRAVIIRGTGPRGFCAGGDIKSLTRPTDGRSPLETAVEFFANEYFCDYAIHAYPKPIAALLYGITMGGGVGLTRGAAFRIVTPEIVMAMPEIGIGLYPDVGATHFLSRMPGKLGLFLGLTGARLNATDALEFGWATHAIEAHRFEALFEGLVAREWALDPSLARHEMGSLIKIFAAAVDHQSLPPPILRQKFVQLENLIDTDSLEKTLENFKAALTSDALDSYLRGAFESALAGAPTSQRLIFDLWKLGSQLSLEEVFETELGVSIACCLHGDFSEGVRARLIDRDQKPVWNPASLSDAGSELMQKFFETPWKRAESPLAQIHELKRFWGK